MLGHFRGDDLPLMHEMLARFERQHGIATTYEGVEQVAQRLQERVESGVTPDVILLPVPGWLDALAEGGAIVPLAENGARAVETHFGPAWTDLVTYDGRIYGVPFNAEAKSLLWYRPSVLDELGATPPQSFEELAQIAAARATEGKAAFALPGQIGWTLTDAFENVLLATAGPEVYDALITHQIAWTDPRVERAAQRFVALLRDEWLMGGTEGMLAMPLWSESFAEALTPDEPAAAFWLGPDSVIAGSGLVEGEDFELAAFPTGGIVMGVGSVLVATNDAPETMALLAYLAQPEAIEPWVRAGAFISPNQSIAPEAYPTRRARREAELLAAASSFRYDLSDQLPPNLKDTFLPDQLAQMLRQPDQLPAILAGIERVATREQGAPPERSAAAP
ncbi:MAG: ABC transporter substrate-binding protein [Ardenticatenaceae bacterium]